VRAGAIMVRPRSKSHRPSYLWGIRPRGREGCKWRAPRRPKRRPRCASVGSKTRSAGQDALT